MAHLRTRSTTSRWPRRVAHSSKLLWALAVVGALAACTVTPTATPTGPPPSAAEAEIPDLEPERIPVFVSTDMGGDDTVPRPTLLLHLGNPNIALVVSPLFPRVADAPRPPVCYHDRRGPVELISAR